MKLLAIDIGFAATGIAVMERGIDNEWRVSEIACIATKDDKTRKSIRKAESDVDRVSYLARSICNILDNHGAARVVVELPHGGALNARAIRAMALVSGMIATIVELRQLACEWYSPNETRIAAVGRGKGVSKQEVIDAMSAKWPGHKLNEHTADALATFEAARAGNLVRL